MVDSSFWYRSRPPCQGRHGQYYLTKALQTKVAMARALAWELRVLSGSDLSAAASAAASSAVRESAPLLPPLVLLPPASLTRSLPKSLPAPVAKRSPVQVAAPAAKR